MTRKFIHTATLLISLMISSSNAMEDTQQSSLSRLPIDATLYSFITSDDPTSMPGSFEREKTQFFNPSVFIEVKPHYVGRFEEDDQLSIGSNGFVSVVRQGKSLTLKGFRFGQSGVLEDGQPDMKFCGFAYLAFTTGWDTSKEQFVNGPIKLEIRNKKIYARDNTGKLFPEFFFLDPKPDEFVFCPPNQAPLDYWKDDAKAFLKELGPR